MLQLLRGQFVPNVAGTANPLFRRKEYLRAAVGTMDDTLACELELAAAVGALILLHHGLSIHRVELE